MEKVLEFSMKSTLEETATNTMLYLNLTKMRKNTFLAGLISIAAAISEIKTFNVGIQNLNYLQDLKIFKIFVVHSALFAKVLKYQEVIMAYIMVPW